MDALIDELSRPFLGAILLQDFRTWHSATVTATARKRGFGRFAIANNCRQLRRMRTEFPAYVFAFASEKSPNTGGNGFDGKPLKDADICHNRLFRIDPTRKRHGIEQDLERCSDLLVRSCRRWYEVVTVLHEVCPGFRRESH